MHPNENGHFRGLHIAIINPLSGDIKSAEVFDTYKSSERLDYFLTLGVPECYIVAAACKDDCSKGLSQYAKNWFRSMGAEEIQRVEYRQSFAFIGVNQRYEANEKRGKASE